MWFLFALGSALFLGVYDVFKKLSVNDNAVLPVLFFSTLTSALLFIPLLVGSYFELIPANHLLYIPPITLKEHLLISLKAAIVLISWIFSFFALKHLPITIVSPIRATGPLWTLIGAIILYGEKLTMMQWSGMAITLCFFFLFSTAGKREGISFTKNKWVWFIILGTLAGTASGLYDKFLIREIHRMAVQSYFSIYQVVLMTPIIFLLWWPNRQKLTPFKWRFTIPLIGLFLVIADFFYFYALSYPDSMISIISALRRGSVIIAFSFGALLFKERHIAMKALYLAGIMLGILFLVFGSR